jgi:glutamyl-tRNA synthetase
MSETKKKVVVRMAPSPTGYFHIGSVRTALFNFLFARQNEGTFIFRSEDTNDARSKQEYEDNILESLKWLGLSYDMFMKQSERTDVYVSYLKKMIENGSAYISKDEAATATRKGEEIEQRSEVIRLKNPNKKIIFEDLVRGTVEFDTTESGDFVIAKSLTEPLYHLAVVVDDHETGATHIIRGEDILSSTPRQILIQEAIGATRPIYAHIPLILAPDRSKLSKRYGATSLVEYQKQGYLPEAILNYMALLGWNPGTEKEIFTLPELIEAFSIEKVQKGGAIFDEKKLRWVNKEHIKLQKEKIIKLIEEKISHKYPEQEIPVRTLELIFERIEVLTDIDRLIEEGDLDYFFNEPILAKEKIAWKTSTPEEAKKHLEHIVSIISDPDAVMKYAEAAGKGNVLWPLRYSLSGKEKSPDPFTLLSILGPTVAKERIEKAISVL